MVSRLLVSAGQSIFASPAPIKWGTQKQTYSSLSTDFTHSLSIYECPPCSRFSRWHSANKEIAALTCFCVVWPGRVARDDHLSSFGHKESVKTSGIAICWNPLGLCMPATGELRHPDWGPLHWGWNSGQDIPSVSVNSIWLSLTPLSWPLRFLWLNIANPHLCSQASPHGNKGARWGSNFQQDGKAKPAPPPEGPHCRAYASSSLAVSRTGFLPQGPAKLGTHKHVIHSTSIRELLHICCVPGICVSVQHPSPCGAHIPVGVVGWGDRQET